MTQYHEPVSELPDKDRDFVRALNSVKEELEADIGDARSRVVEPAAEQLAGSRHVLKRDARLANAKLDELRQQLERAEKEAAEAKKALDEKAK